MTPTEAQRLVLLLLEDMTARPDTVWPNGSLSEPNLPRLVVREGPSIPRVVSLDGDAVSRCLMQLEVHVPRNNPPDETRLLVENARSVFPAGLTIGEGAWVEAPPSIDRYDDSQDDRYVVQMTLRYGVIENV